MLKRCSVALCCLLLGASSAAACGSADEKVAVRAGGGAGGDAGGTADTTNGGHAASGPDAGGASGGAALTSGGVNANDGMTADGGANSSSSAKSSGGAAGATENGDGGAAFSGLGGAGCDAPVTELPDLTTGAWLICNAIDTNNRNWTGVFTVATETPTCDGANVSGTFHWTSTNLGNVVGDTAFDGSYDAITHQITVSEYEVTDGSVVTGIDTMLYDAASDTLKTGAWTCSCAAGAWDEATRIAIDGDTTCQ